LFSKINSSQNKNSRFRQAVEKQRNVTTLEGIEITGWDENEERLIVEAKWAKEKETLSMPAQNVEARPPPCGNMTAINKREVRSGIPPGQESPF